MGAKVEHDVASEHEYWYDIEAALLQNKVFRYSLGNWGASYARVHFP